MRGKPSPVLLIFLVFPLLGLLAAAVVMISNSPGGVSGTHPTPAPVTLAPPKMLPNSPVIGFTLTSLDGKTVSLSDYAGRVVFLNFWATWCVPCQTELPAFQEFQAQQAADGAAILAVNVYEAPEQVTDFLTRFDVHGLNVLLDSDAKVSDSYGIFNMPTTFVIDKQGIVRFPKYGAMTVADLQSYVDALDATT